MASLVYFPRESSQPFSRWTAIATLCLQYSLGVARLGAPAPVSWVAMENPTSFGLGKSVDFKYFDVLTLGADSSTFDFFQNVPTSCYEPSELPQAQQAELSNAMTFDAWAQTYTSDFGYSSDISVPLEAGLLSASISKGFKQTSASFNTDARRLVTLTSENFISSYQMKFECLSNEHLVLPSVFSFIQSMKVGDYTSEALREWDHFFKSFGTHVRSEIILGTRIQATATIARVGACQVSDAQAEACQQFGFGSNVASASSCRDKASASEECKSSNDLEAFCYEVGSINSGLCQDAGRWNQSVTNLTASAVEFKYRSIPDVFYDIFNAHSRMNETVKSWYDTLQRAMDYHYCLAPYYIWDDASGSCKDAPPGSCTVHAWETCHGLGSKCEAHHDPPVNNCNEGFKPHDKTDNIGATTCHTGLCGSGNCKIYWPGSSGCVHNTIINSTEVCECIKDQ